MRLKPIVFASISLVITGSNIRSFPPEPVDINGRLKPSIGCKEPEPAPNAPEATTLVVSTLVPCAVSASWL